MAWKKSSSNLELSSRRPRLGLNFRARLDPVELGGERQSSNEDGEGGYEILVHDLVSIWIMYLVSVPTM